MHKLDLVKDLYCRNVAYRLLKFHSPISCSCWRIAAIFKQTEDEFEFEWMKRHPYTIQRLKINSRLTREGRH